MVSKKSKWIDKNIHVHLLIRICIDNLGIRIKKVILRKGNWLKSIMMLIFQTSKDLFLFADLIFNFRQDFIVLLEQDWEFL